MKEKLTQSSIHAVLDYDPKTGEFTWKSDRTGGTKAGSRAGYTDSGGYRVIKVYGLLYKAHRIAWVYINGEWPKGQIDHINRNPSDNRIKNLREISHSDNQRNRGLMKSNGSGVTGVYWHKGQKTWHARIGVDGKHRHLGSFTDFDDAVLARKDAERIYGYHPNHGS